jgi:hypothetical protein
MRIIKTGVVKKVERIVARTEQFDIRICLNIPICFEFSEVQLRLCLKKLQQTTPQIRNKPNRESWERVIRTAELLLNDKTPDDIAKILGLKASTIKSYLGDLDAAMNKI